VTLLLDSNIIIYAAAPEYDDLRTMIAAEAPSVSVVSVVEVLGYHKLTSGERQLFESFFTAAQVLPITDDVIAHAVRLRQQRKMALGDALIAATALALGLELLTRNTSDFAWISGLHVRNPISSQ
jgi:predicted nucleic acid-binding protein